MTTDTHPTKDPVTLDHLKQAINAVPMPPDGVKANGMHWSHFVYAELKADAWRTAFEWLNGIVAADVDEIRMDYDEGMRLIRENLK